MGALKAEEALVLNPQDKEERALTVKLCQYLVAEQISKRCEKIDWSKKRAHVPLYKVGNLVFARANYVNDRSFKLRYRYKGPFRIDEIIGNTVVLKSLATGKSSRVSMRAIRLYHNENITRTESDNARKPFPSPLGDFSEEDEGIVLVKEANPIGSGAAVN